MKTPITYLILALLCITSCSKDEVSEPINYVVSFESNGGTPVANQTVKEGLKAITPAPPTRPEYNFVNWYKESTLSTVFNFNLETINSNRTLYAKWDQVNYTVTFNSNGGTLISDQNVPSGETVIEPTTPTKAGYVFINWYKDSALTTVFDFNTEVVSSNISLYAKWAIGYTVIFNLNGGTGTSIDNQTVAEGSNANSPESDANLYCLDFNGWHTNSNFDSPFDFSTAINNNLVLYARYTNASFLHNPNTKAELQDLVDNITDLSTINTCGITDMSYLFENKTLASDFNGSLSNWNVSNVTNMQAMFNEAAEFNQNINAWEVSNVTNMIAMFQGATIFNQPLDNWNVSSATDFAVMFRWAKAFNQNINSWDVSNVNKISAMFQGAELFNQPLDNWNVSNVTKMSSVFSTAYSFNQNINSWDVSSVTDMENMFAIASAFNQPLDTWDVSSVTNFYGTFRNMDVFNQDISSWDVSSATTMLTMFAGSTVFNVDLSSWNVSNVTNMHQMFYTAASFNQPNIIIWDIQPDTDIELMLKSTAMPTTFRFDSRPDDSPF